MERQHVIIIAQGGFGNVKEEEYRSTAEIYLAMLETARSRDPRTGEEVQRTTAEIVLSLATLSDKLAAHPRPNAVVFLTRGLLQEARAIKREFPRMKVVVVTGAIPDDEIILVDKRADLGIDALRSIILD